MKTRKENKDFLRINCLAVILFLVFLTPPKIYSQAQEQGLLFEGRTNLCTPHTNKPVDSPSTTAWANISAPNDSALQQSESGALQDLQKELSNNKELYSYKISKLNTAQGQRSLTSNKTNLCTPHTNKPVDSPSTTAWANISAPNDSALQQSESGALQNFTSVKHEEIYTKVDAVVILNKSTLKSEFVVNPGAELHHIMLTYNRARNIKINNKSELVHDGEFRRFAINEPIVYQLVEGDNKVVQTHYEIDKDGIVSFDIADFDKSIPLFIVPTTNEISEFTEYNKSLFNNKLNSKMALKE